MQSTDKIVICAHCNRSAHTIKSMWSKCKSFTMEVPLVNVILKYDRVGGNVIFYDPDIEKVNAKRKELNL